MADCSDFNEIIMNKKVTQMNQSSCSAPSFVKEMIPNLLLAVSLHFNFYFSVAYAFLIGRLVALKLMHFRFDDGLQEAILLPVYSECAVGYTSLKAIKKSQGTKGIILNIITVLYFILKASDQAMLHLRFIITGIWLVVEGLRLYLGQSGNLCERISQVAAFVLLSIFPQLFIVLYLAFFQEFIFPCDYAIGSLMLVMIVLEVFFGCQALRSFIQRQTELFYSTHRVGEMQRLNGEEGSVANELFFSKDILCLKKSYAGETRHEEKFDINEAKL